MDFHEILMTGSLKLRDFPLPWVELACGKCGRHGRLRRDRLIEHYGADIKLPDLLEEIAQCPRARKYADYCGAYYVALKSGG